MSKIWVTKNDGSQQAYDQAKVLNAMKMAGIKQDRIPVILLEIEKKLYPGITTSEIYKNLHSEIASKTSTLDAKFFRAREGLAKIGSFVFEKLVAEILQTMGYSCSWNVIVQGHCTEHQADVIAEKNGQKLFVEVKHHRNEHRETGLGDAVETWGRFMDIKEADTQDSKSFTAAALVTNTKFSAHAIKFSSCRQIPLLGWRYCSLDGVTGLEETLNQLGREKVVQMIDEIV